MEWISITDDEPCRCFVVLYGKISTRKHKRWQSDGLLFCRKRSVVLKAEVKQFSSLAYKSNLHIPRLPIFAVLLSNVLEWRRACQGEWLSYQAAKRIS